MQRRIRDDRVRWITLSGIELGYHFSGDPASRDNNLIQSEGQPFILQEGE